MAAMEAEGQSLGTGFLFCLLNASRTAFLDEPLKAPALRKRIQQHMRKAALFEGKTLHIFRQSAVQHEAEIEGYDVKRLMERGRWASYSAFKLYAEEIVHKFGRRPIV
jgi:hypothetical protein